MKSLFKGALSYKHDHKFSLREDVSGTLWYSVIYLSSLEELSTICTSLKFFVKNLSIPSRAQALSSLSINSSSNIQVDPHTRSLPPDLLSA